MARQEGGGHRQPHVADPDDWDTENPDIEGFRARFGTEWFITVPVDGDGPEGPLGPLADLLEPKAAWTAPTG